MYMGAYNNVIWALYNFPAVLNLRHSVGGHEATSEN